MVLVADREALTGFVMLWVPGAVLCQGTEQLFPPTSQDCMALCRAGQGIGEKGTGEPTLPDFMGMGLQWWARRAAKAGRGQEGFQPGTAPGAGPQQGQGWVCVSSTEQAAVEGPAGTQLLWADLGTCASPRAPRGVAEAQPLGDAPWATRDETGASTLTPSLITRSYTGAYARNQAEYAGSCVQKIALCQRPGQAIQKVLEGSSPCPSMTLLAAINGLPLQTKSIMTLGSARGFLKSVQD